MYKYFQSWWKIPSIPSTVASSSGTRLRRRLAFPRMRRSDFNLLILTLVPGKHCTKLLDVLGSHPVPPSQGVSCHRNGSKALLPAGRLLPPWLKVISFT